MAQLKASQLGGVPGCSLEAISFWYLLLGDNLMVIKVFLANYTEKTFFLNLKELFSVKNSKNFCHLN